MIPLFLAASVATPTPGEIKAFADWTVGCDNVRSCQAVGLMPHDDVGGSTMVITRGSVPDAIPELRINIQQGSATSLALDGKPLPVRIKMIDGVVHVDVRDGLEMVKSIRKGKQLDILDRARKPVGSVALQGLTAAMIYMDDQQKRTGLLSAIARQGKIPDSDGEAPPAPPVIFRSPESSLPPLSLTKTYVDRTHKALLCEAVNMAFYEPSYIRLDAGTTLALLPWPCGNGAYNYFTYAVLIDQKGEVRSADFDQPPGLGEGVESEVVNAEWHPDTRLLSNFFKGRGLGDCGYRQFFAWDGTRFRLARREDMHKCRGSTDFILTWIAEVR